MPAVISVIIPFHNAQKTLATTLDSLQSQSFQEWQALLVNDGSKDGSLQIAQTYAAQDPRLKIVQTPRQVGVARARSLGMSKAEGRYIAFLDADDQWLPQKLERQLPLLQEGAPLVFSSYHRVSAQGEVLGTVKARPRISYSDLLSGNPIGCLTAIWDRNYFGLPEMPNLRMHEDYAFWLNMLRNGGYGVGVAEPLARYRVSPQSRSAHKVSAALATWMILRQEPGLSFLGAARGFCSYGYHSLAKRMPVKG